MQEDDEKKLASSSEAKESEAEELEENDGVGQSYAPTNYSYLSDRKKSRKTVYLVIILVVILMAIGAFIFNRVFTKGENVQPSPTPTSAPTPAEIPQPVLSREEWSFEVLNGSGITGLAKKVADQLQELGYQVVKVGNADKDDYQLTQILVRSDLREKVDLMIADLKDVVKIALVAGELKDSTASARIILGKDL